MSDELRAPRPITTLDVEAVRFAGERTAAAAMRADAWLQDLIHSVEQRGRPDAGRVKRQLMTRSLKLTDGMAPDAWSAARSAAEVLGVQVPLELYQAAGAENAAIHLIDSPVLLEIRGRLLSLLDQAGTVSVFGHELGHYLAHGVDSPDVHLGPVVNAVLNQGGAPEHAVRRASALAMGREITADRFGLLACQDLHAALRTEMAATTGLSSGELSFDTTAYLEQCKALIAEATAADANAGNTHPEHGLRAWALWLYSETAEYAALTGVGVGTRALADVDNEIAVVLGHASTDGLVDGALTLEPIPELHECALAAAALVALADGALAEEEALAIEGVFASLVPDWQRYLVWDNALEAFADTGSVVIAAGPSAQRSLFQILVHVLAADGKVETSEVEMICAVGDALRCGTLFRALLTPVLTVLGFESPDLSTVTRVIPMPARADEAEAALQVFLQGIVRRRGGHSTVQRMARLLGDREATDASRALIAERVVAMGLIATPDLAQAELTRTIELGLTEETRARLDAEEHPSVPLPEQPGRAQLTQALTRLRDQLVSGDGRSPSIRLRACVRGRSFDLFGLESMSVGHAERTLALVQERQSARLVDGSEIGVHEGAEAVAQDLVALEREALLRLEQTGARDLYVGAPFLTGVFQGYLVRGPLVLYPCDLERSRGRGFALKPREDEPLANQALIRLLFGKKGVAFPDTLAEQLDQAACEGVEALRVLLSEHGFLARPEGEALGELKPRDEAFETWANGRLVIERVAALGFFPQSSSDVISDYNALLASVSDPSVDLAARLGAAGLLLPAELRATLSVAGQSEASTAPIVPVVPSDPTQLAVIARARTERVLVVDGPPGTGKSQVIVNLVADALARGQSVAVVCEKRAALDVVAQRLEQVGLRHLLALVHHVHDDRRGLYDQVVKRLSEGLQRDHDAVRSERLADDHSGVLSALRERREALALALGDEQPTLGQLHLIAASIDTPPLAELPPSLLRLPFQRVRALAERLGREARHADLHVATSPWRAPSGFTRPSLASAAPDALASAEDRLRDALRTSEALDARCAQQQVRRAALFAACAALREAAATQPHRADRFAREAFAAWLSRGDDPGLRALVAELRAAWASPEAWAAEIPKRATFELSPPVEGALAVIQGWGSSPLRYLSCPWGKARQALQAALTAQWPAALGTSVDAALVARVHKRAAGARAWLALDELLAALRLDPVLPTTDAAVAVASALLDTFGATRALVESEGPLRSVEAWPSPGRNGIEQWDARLAERLTLCEALEAHSAACRAAAPALPWLSDRTDTAILARSYEAWSLDASRVVGSDRNLDAAQALHPDARELVQRLADHGAAAEADWVDAFMAGWALTSIHAVERGHPAARQLDRATPHGEVAEAEALLAKLVHERGEDHVARIVRDLDRVPLLTELRPDKGERRTPVQKAREQLLREASKRRNVLSLRGFVRQFATDGLMELLPVWLLSPETMAVLFPGEPVFDRIVMDEASQCTVEKGFPTLIRGRSAVIAGDDKQMPPTSFFELRASDDDDAVGTAETVEADALSAESLLVLARERCAHDALQWHYRCVYEELIAFSNFAMYGGDLRTVPSVATSTAPPALRWEHVADGAYDRGGNPIEAERVVALIAELLQEPGPPSIGVVTFNIQQRRLVFDAIDRRVDADEAFAAAWTTATGDDELDRRPFVKSLENVQGDERDVILFSLGHAPVERKTGPLKGQVYVPARFGPLGQIGGERRLNVAISRAKQRCVVVASFEPSMLSVAGTRHEGPKLLKAFLEFVWDLTHGRRLQAGKTLERVRHGSLVRERATASTLAIHTPSLAAQIGLRLDKAGVAYDLDVGSGGFRVPLALRVRDDETRYDVAVLTDDGTEHAPTDELHRHRPALLAARGWTVVRVDARRWQRDADGALAEILGARG